MIVMGRELGMRLLECEIDRWNVVPRQDLESVCTDSCRLSLFYLVKSVYQNAKNNQLISLLTGTICLIREPEGSQARLSREYGWLHYSGRLPLQLVNQCADC